MNILHVSRVHAMDGCYDDGRKEGVIGGSVKCFPVRNRSQSLLGV